MFPAVTLPHLVQEAVATISAASLLYLLGAVLAVKTFRLGSPAPPGQTPPITVLKPLCGDEVGLEEGLRSFFLQDLPAFQIVFGAAAASDPALGIARRVARDFPARDVAFVAGGPTWGSNPKAGNLHNMVAAARHELLVISDSDMRVPPDYLRTVAAPFSDPGVGAVTCLYVGVPNGGLAARLAAQFVDENFLPSVLVALRVEKLRYCFGATMACRRETLERIGDFRSLSDMLADDYHLGSRIDRLGLEVRLAPCLVETLCTERGFAELIQHELRWARTVRAVRPVGFAFSFLTDTLMVTLICAAAVRFAPWSVGTVALALALRIALQAEVRRKFLAGRPGAPIWTIPIRDAVTFGVRIASFFGHNVAWRRHTLTVDAAGKVREPGKEPS